MQVHTITHPKKSPKISICEVCSKEFTVKPKTSGRFCSRACRGVWWGKHYSKDLYKRGLFKLTKEYIEEQSKELSLKEEESDDTLWALRGSYWEEQSTNPIQHSKSTNREEAAPLILTGHGVSLRVDHGALVIQDGFTYYPQKRKEYRFFAFDINLPSRIILLDSDGSLTLDVITWLAQHKIPLVSLNWQGEVINVFGNDSFSTKYELRNAQLQAKENGKSIEMALFLIIEKIKRCTQTIMVFPQNLEREYTKKRLDSIIDRLTYEPPFTNDELMILEAQAANAYFSLWQSTSIKWKGLKNHFIPEEWKQIGARNSLLSGTNRHAVHPANAILNYAYGVLESQVRITAVSNGLDPYLGFLHASHKRRIALIYDLMEPLRPIIDQKILSLLRSYTFTPCDFIVSEKGICRLHPQFARKIASLEVSQKEIEAVIRQFCTHLLN